MPTAPHRLALISLAATAAVLALAGCGTENTTAPTPAASTPTPTTTGAPTPSSTPGPVVATAPTVQRVEVRFAGGAVVGGVSSPRVPLGSTVKLAVTSDVADEIHLHGYNKTAQVAAGKTATLTFVANTPGTFEVELENRGAKLVDIQVR